MRPDPYFSTSPLASQGLRKAAPAGQAGAVLGTWRTGAPLGTTAYSKTPAGGKSLRPKWHERPRAMGHATGTGKPSSARWTDWRSNPPSAAREQAKAVQTPAPEADRTGHRGGLACGVTPGDPYMDPPEATKLLGVIVPDRKIGSRPEPDPPPLDLGGPCEFLAVPSLSDGLAEQKSDAAVEFFQHLFLPELIGVLGPLLLAYEEPPA